MYYTFDIEAQLKRILKNESIFSETTPSGDKFISDVYDGLFYRNILNSQDGDLIKSRKVFTFSINTDGISVCENIHIFHIYFFEFFSIFCFFYIVFCLVSNISYNLIKRMFC